MANLERDEDVFDLVSRVRAEDRTIEETKTWAARAEAMLEALTERGWKEVGEPERQFVVQDLEPFLRRLEQLDQTDEYRPGRRDSLVRR